MVARSPDPYDILGIKPGASAEEMKSAYRVALRAAHPDTGGSPERFALVQRAWKEISGPSSLPTGSSRVPSTHRDTSWMARSPSPRGSITGGIKSYGHPGGWFRELYGRQVRSWWGLGSTPDNIFDPAIIDQVPPEIRHTLDAAIAEEATATALAELGPPFVVWHDVLVEGDRSSTVSKIDHVLLGPSLLWAIASENWGSAVRIVRGELVGEGIPGTQKPWASLWSQARYFPKSLGVKVSALAYVVPDDHAEHDVALIRLKRGIPCYLVRQSAVCELVTGDTPATSRSLVGDDLFPVREKLSAGIRFV